MVTMPPVGVFVSHLNAGGIFEIDCFYKYGDKKSQILTQQNLASEEGDEKLQNNDFQQSSD